MNSRASFLRLVTPCLIICCFNVCTSECMRKEDKRRREWARKTANRMLKQKQEKLTPPSKTRSLQKTNIVAMKNYVLIPGAMPGCDYIIAITEKDKKTMLAWKTSMEIQKQTQGSRTFETLYEPCNAISWSNSDCGHTTLLGQTLGLYLYEKQKTDAERLRTEICIPLTIEKVKEPILKKFKTKFLSEICKKNEKIDANKKIYAYCGKYKVLYQIK